MSGTPSIDIPSICRKAVQDLRRDSTRKLPKPDESKLEGWRNGLTHLRVTTNSDSVWEQATKLLARLNLAKEGLWTIESSEIEDFLRGSLESPADKTQLVSDLSDACIKAEQHLSFAQELLSRFDHMNTERWKAGKGNRNLNSDISKLVEEIATDVERVISEAKDELSKLEEYK